LILSASSSYLKKGEEKLSSINPLIGKGVHARRDVVVTLSRCSASQNHLNIMRRKFGAKLVVF